MAKLILIRHGRSAWNDQGLWTGQTDIELTDEGREEARKSAQELKDLQIHAVHISKLKRAKETWAIIKEELQITEIPELEHEALNERDYGKFTGKNKWDVQKEIGEEEFLKLRRNWDHPIPGGETLKDVHARVVPYFEEQIKPQLLQNQNVLVSAHGNSLRALVKHLEDIHEDEISGVEIGTCEVYIYEIDSTGKVLEKEIRATNDKKV